MYEKKDNESTGKIKIINKNVFKALLLGVTLTPHCGYNGYNYYY